MTTPIFTFSKNPFADMRSRSTCLNLAADLVDRADEERKLAGSLMERIQNIAISVILSVGLVLSTGIAATAFALYRNITTLAALGSVALYPFAAMGLLIEVGTVLMIYLMHQRSIHLSLARGHEVDSMYANTRAAEIPAYKDYGLISGIFGFLFHASNPVTRYGDRKHWWRG